MGRRVIRIHGGATITDDVLRVARGFSRQPATRSPQLPAACVVVLVAVVVRVIQLEVEHGGTTAPVGAAVREASPGREIVER